MIPYSGSCVTEKAKVISTNHGRELLQTKKIYVEWEQNIALSLNWQASTPTLLIGRQAKSEIIEGRDENGF